LQNLWEHWRLAGKALKNADIMSATWQSRKVLQLPQLSFLSAPGKSGDESKPIKIFVICVNEGEYNTAKHQEISNAY